MIKRIRVTYNLTVAGDIDRETIDRVLQKHADACPVYRSLHPQIEISTSLDVVSDTLD